MPDARTFPAARSEQARKARPPVLGYGRGSLRRARQGRGGAGAPRGLEQPSTRRESPPPSRSARKEGAAEQVSDKATRSPPRWARAHADEQLAWDDVENVFDRHNCDPGSEQTSAHDELVGSVVEPAVPHPFDDAETPVL
jgi:hypothetical protein